MLHVNLVLIRRGSLQRKSLFGQWLNKADAIILLAAKSTFQLLRSPSFNPEPPNSGLRSLNYFRFLHYYIFQWYVLVAASITGFHFLDPVYHILAKHAIAETLGGRCSVIEEIIVSNIDKKL